MKKLDIQVGTKFGELTVIKELESNSNIRKFRFKCSCGNTVDMLLNNLLARNIKSCRKCRSNSYDIRNGVVYGKDSKQREFSLDEKDFSIVSGKNVYIDTPHYSEVIVWDKGKRTVLHDLLCPGYDKKQLMVDHIDFDPTNNRRKNLRLIHKNSPLAKYNKTVKYYFRLLGLSSTIEKKGVWVLTIKNSHILYTGEYVTKANAIYAEKLWLYFNYDIGDDALYIDIPRIAKIDFVNRTGSKKRVDTHNSIGGMLLNK